MRADLELKSPKGEAALIMTQYPVSRKKIWQSTDGASSQEVCEIRNINTKSKSKYTSRIIILYHPVVRDALLAPPHLPLVDFFVSLDRPEPPTPWKPSISPLLTPRSRLQDIPDLRFQLSRSLLSTLFLRLDLLSRNPQPIFILFDPSFPLILRLSALRLKFR